MSRLDITSHVLRQPRYVDQFSCIGPECEDSCCRGWGIPVDSQTYEKFRSLDFRIAGKTLSSLVEINPASSSSVDYARIRLEGTACPAHNEGWCSVQQELGEPYLPDLCSSYPRALNIIGGTVEKSLHLSCPEAARLVLRDPDAMVVCERMEESLPDRAGSLTVVTGAADENVDRVRQLMIEVIRERSVPLWQRIVSLGFAVDRIAGVDTPPAVGMLKSHLSALRQGLLQSIFASLHADPAFQLETVMKLVVARLEADYTPPGFVECYREFMRGLDWTNESTMEELASRYQRASEDCLVPFLHRHEHVLENYLASYIFRTIFPYRRRQPNQTFAIDSGKESMQEAFLLLATHYAIVKTLFAGMAALHKQNLDMGHAVKLVQSYSKAFLHSSSFEAIAIQALRKNVQHPTRIVAALVRD